MGGGKERRITLLPFATAENVANERQRRRRNCSVVIMKQKDSP